MKTIQISKTLDTNNILVTETNINNKKQPTKYYVVPQENADAFISGKTSLNGIDILQKIGSALIGVFVGISAYRGIQTPLPKILTGVLVGAGTFVGALFVDRAIDKQAINNLCKRTGAHEITGDKEKLAQIQQ